jgi:hypothetical protein
MADIGQKQAVGGRSVPRRSHVTHNGQGAPGGAAAIVTALADAGTTVVFGLPGGGPNLDVVGAAAVAGLRFVLAHTETAAVIMAATYADLTGMPGAAVVTRGPGFASAINGIAHAALDRLPVVVITDTVRLADAGRISHQRLDQAALGAVVAKAVVTIGRDRTGEAAAVAVRLALMPPAGPVVALMDDSGISDPGGAPRHRRPSGPGRLSRDHGSEPWRSRPAAGAVLKREISEDDPVEGQRVTDQLDRIWVKYTGNEPPYALRDPSINERRVLFEMEVVKVATFGRP